MDIKLEAVEELVCLNGTAQVKSESEENADFQSETVFVSPVFVTQCATASEVEYNEMCDEIEIKEELCWLPNISEEGNLPFSLNDDFAMKETDEEMSDLSFTESEDEFSEMDIPQSRNVTSDVNVSSTAKAATPALSKWVEVSDLDCGFCRIPVANIEQGPILPSHFNSDTTPIEYFSLFFDDEVVDLIAQETTLYGDRRKQQHSPSTKKSRFTSWKPPSTCDIRAFLGIIINMGLHPLPDIQEYFCKSWTDKMEFFGNVFARDEFLLLFWNLPFAHRDEIQGLKKGDLIWTTLQKIKEKCQLFYSPGENISVNESTISSDGRVSFRVYNLTKPTKFDLKVFALSDSTNGYLYTFKPYMGKEDNSDPDLKVTQVVKDLCITLIKNTNSPPSGHHIFTGNYFSSLQLAETLWNMKMVTTGRVKLNRKGMPAHLKKVKKMKKGDIVSFRNNENLVLTWKHKKLINMLSTKHKGDKHKVTNVPSKSPNLCTPIPDVFLDYAINIGGVGRSDLCIACYQFLKTVKWYRKMLIWLLEVAVVNSFLLYSMVQEKENKPPMSHRKFRKYLVHSLVSERMQMRQIKTMRAIRDPCYERLSGLPHFIGRKAKGTSRCVVCKAKGLRKETIYFCKTCITNPVLHPDTCFELYHTQEQF